MFSRAAIPVERRPDQGGATCKAETHCAILRWRPLSSFFRFPAAAEVRPGEDLTRSSSTAVSTVDAGAPGPRPPQCATAASSRSAATKVMPLKGDTTQVVDLAGRMALPGFHDSHVHVASSGLGRCSARSATSRPSKRCSTSARSARPGRRKNGSSAVAGGSRCLITVDRARNCLIRRFRAVQWFCTTLTRTAWVSSRALELAGITASTPDPEDGVIERDPRTGDPSGTLREATDLVMAKAPAPSAEMRLEGSGAGCST